MQIELIIKLLILLTCANGSPVIAKRILGDRFAWPLDAGVKFPDGRPLFGASKTLRGIAAAIVVTTVAALLLGLSWQVGLWVGAVAMAGDLLSSFVKRRLGLPPSSQALGLDQVPESLFPLVAVATAVGLTTVDIVATTALFFVGELIISRILFKLHVRDRPY